MDLWILGFAVMVGAYLISIRRAELPKELTIVLLLGAIFGVIVGVQSLRSPAPLPAFTRTIAVLERVILVFIIGITIADRRSLQRLNRLVFIIGVSIISITLPLYVGYLARYRSVIAFVDAIPEMMQWGDAILYIGSGGDVARFTALAGDPGFLTLYVAIALFCGLSMKPKTRYEQILQHGGSFLLVIAVLFSFSRSGLAALILVLVVSLFVNERSIPSIIREKAIAFGPVSAVGGIVISIGVIIGVPAIRDTIKLTLIRRARNIDTLGNRLGDRWSIIYSIEDNLWFGAGTRGAEFELSRTVENMYIPTLYDYGLLGFLFFAAMLAITARRALQLMRHDQVARPWGQAFIMVLLMGVFFSLQYSYVLYIAMGITLATYRIDELSTG